MEDVEGTSPGADAVADMPITVAHHAVADAPRDDIKAPSNKQLQRPPPPEYKPTDHLVARTSAPQQCPPDDLLNADTTRRAANC